MDHTNWAKMAELVKPAIEIFLEACSYQIKSEKWSRGLTSLINVILVALKSWCRGKMLSDGNL